MAEVTTRLALPYPEDDDPADVPADIQALTTRLDLIAASDDQGTLSARPAPGKKGRYYWATDQQRLYRDDGTAWRTITGAVPAEVTSLPSSPVEGQEIRLRPPSGLRGELEFSATWWLKFNGLDWEPMGQAEELYTGVFTNLLQASAGTDVWQPLATPVLTLPFRGIWHVQADIGYAGPEGANIHSELYVGTVAPTSEKYTVKLVSFAPTGAFSVGAKLETHSLFVCQQHHPGEDLASPDWRIRTFGQSPHPSTTHAPVPALRFSVGFQSDGRNC